eukprot:RCo044457
MLTLDCGVLCRVGLRPTPGHNGVVSAGGLRQPAVILDYGVLLAQRHFVEEHHPNPLPVCIRGANVTIGLGALRGKVNALSDPASAVGHDSQPRLQDSRHHGHVGAMPQQLAVGEGLVGGEPLPLPLPVHLKSVQKLEVARPRVRDIRLDDLVLRGGLVEGHELAVQGVVLAVQRVVDFRHRLRGGRAGLLLQLLRHCNIVQGVQQVVLALHTFHGVNDGWAVAAKVVRDDGVELAGQGFVLSLLARLDGLLQSLQGLKALLHLSLRKLPQGHLLGVNVHGLHGLLEHVLAEHQLQEGLQRRLQLARPVLHRRRGGCSLRWGLVRVLVLHLQQVVLPGVLHEVGAVIPFVLRFVPKLSVKVLLAVFQARAVHELILARLAHTTPPSPKEELRSGLQKLDIVVLVVVLADVGLVQGGVPEAAVGLHHRVRGAVGHHAVDRGANHLCGLDRGLLRGRLVSLPLPLSSCRLGRRCGLRCGLRSGFGLLGWHNGRIHHRQMRWVGRQMQ